MEDSPKISPEGRLKEIFKMKSDTREEIDRLEKEEEHSGQEEEIEKKIAGLNGTLEALEAEEEKIRIELERFS